MDHKLRWKRIRALWGRTNWKEIVSTFSGSISALERSFKTIEKSFSRHEVVSVFLQLSKAYEAPLTHCKSAKLHTLHIIIIIGCELKLRPYLIPRSDCCANIYPAWRDLSELADWIETGQLSLILYQLQHGNGCETYLKRKIILANISNRHSYC